jgi:CheY-like chemotaxis protein
MEKRKIAFIIDDDPDDREILIDLVKSIDKEIILWESTNGDEALTKLRRQVGHLPDIIFLDLNMPKVNGIECLRTLKTIEELRNIPVHIYSTSAENNDIDQSLRLGAAGFITKTSNLADLNAKLREILNQVFNYPT